MATDEPLISLPTSFPCLPPHDPDQPWSTNIQSAHEVLTDIYQHAFAVLGEDSDPLRVAFHVDMITADAIPVLHAMEMEGESEGALGVHRLPEEWLHMAAEIFGYLDVSLRVTGQLSKNLCVLPPKSTTINSLPHYPVKIVTSQYLTQSPYFGRVRLGVLVRRSISNFYVKPVQVNVR